MKKYLSEGISLGSCTDNNTAIEKDPNYTVAYYNRANSKRNLGDYRGALLDYNKVIENNPNDADAYHNRGLIKIELGDKESGCLDLSKAGELGDAQAYDAIKQFCK